MLPDEGELTMETTEGETFSVRCPGVLDLPGTRVRFFNCWRRAGDTDASVMVSTPSGHNHRLTKGSSVKIATVQVTVIELRETPDGAVVDGWVGITAGIADEEGLR